MLNCTASACCFSSLNYEKDQEKNRAELANDPRITPGRSANYQNVITNGRYRAQACWYIILQRGNHKSATNTHTSTPTHVHPPQTSYPRRSGSHRTPHSPLPGIAGKTSCPTPARLIEKGCISTFGTRETAKEHMRNQ